MPALSPRLNGVEVEGAAEEPEKPQRHRPCIPRSLILQVPQQHLGAQCALQSPLLGKEMITPRW